jgi:hypothetical protein
MNLQNTLIGFGGIQPPGGLVQFAPNTTRYRPGIIVPFVDDRWGGGELIFARAGNNITPFCVCPMGAQLLQATNALGQSFAQWEVDTGLTIATPNLGNNVCVGLNTVPANTSFDWFIYSMTGGPIKTAAAVTANANAYTTSTAGVISSTQANGQQILNMRFMTTGSGTTTRACSGSPGSNRLRINGSSWGALHLALTATASGIPASTTITGFESDGRGIILSANLTAAVNGNVTFGPGTFTYPLAIWQRPSLQGITT